VMLRRDLQPCIAHAPHNADEGEERDGQLVQDSVEQLVIRAPYPSRKAHQPLVSVA
jgi:hypothetical protein